jgi:hypothetical protein
VGVSVVLPPGAGIADIDKLAENHKVNKVTAHCICTAMVGSVFGIKVKRIISVIETSFSV